MAGQLMKLEQHKGVWVLRDDLLPGGTKSIFLVDLLLKHDATHYVYCSPQYGGFQIALAHACRALGRHAVIVTPKAGQMHPNTEAAAKAGAYVMQVPHGY